MDLETIKALKLCIKGITTKEIITEYAVDDETGELKIVKQKISEKSVPPSVDLLKIIYPHLIATKKDYNKLTDEELETEKQRLLNVSRESIRWMRERFSLVGSRYTKTLR